ncbi:MAG: ATP-dependent helicase [Defluviitaleaceae bacterium]|nr:ATP-dependent helicase [Defluviitaleaceae bacterium]MCL2263696.1 ATP-dependent helicase [Defluviitaleaceae bacterium]
MKDLNENQLQAARHVTGSMMVLAGPGSGKTAVITARSVFLAETQERGVLVITYSKAAANEMVRRFEGLYGQGRSPVTFGTFHSTFFRILRQKNNHELGQILSDHERRGAVRNFLAEMQYEPDDEMLSALLSEMSLVRNELHDLTHYHSKSIGTEDFIFLCKNYEKFKAEKNKIDFDDMLCHAYELLQNDGKLLNYWREKYPFIMIDEFQDINRVQYEAVKLLAAPQNNLFIVGDDDQSIYRFRGSRPEFLLNFPKDFPETRQITLETNYRSTDSIIDYANKLISGNKMRYDKNICGTGQNGVKPVFLTADDQNQEAVLIAKHIRKLWKQGANLDEIAIAFRLNMQSRAFMDAFLNMHIPFRCRDEMPTIYEHWLAEDLYAFMRVARRLSLRQKTGYDADAARIVNKPFRFISKAFLQSIKKNDKCLFKAYKRDPTLHIATKTGIEELEENLYALAKKETTDAIRYIRQNMGYNGHIISTCEYRKLNPAGLFEIADELQEAAKPFANPLDFISHAKNAATAAKEQTHTGEACTLTTLHSAKGLEFERVFIAGVVEEVLPYIRSKTEAEIEEERRLFYVGVTRAKHELYLSTVTSRYDKPAKASRFLDFTT